MHIRIISTRNHMFILYINEEFKPYDIYIYSDILIDDIDMFLNKYDIITRHICIYVYNYIVYMFLLWPCMI